MAEVRRRYFIINSRGVENNIKEINELLDEGWIPIRESAGTDPHPLFNANEKVIKGDIRMWLVLLEKTVSKEYDNPQD